VHKTIYDYEITQHLADLAADHASQLSRALHEAFQRGAAISAAQYEDAVQVKASAETFFATHFNDFDAILSPAASGQAPLLSAGHTGDSIYCTAWTLAGLPCVTLPLLVGADDLPIGVQLIGAAEEDDRLLRTAAWMQRTLAASENGED